VESEDDDDSDEDVGIAVGELGEFVITDVDAVGASVGTGGY
jgi:hypothetical protein